MIAPGVVKRNFDNRYVRALARTAVATSHTGNTNETALATVSIPANTLGLNGRLHITALFSYTNSANTKTLRIRFGGMSGTIYHTVGPTTSASYRTMIEISNRNAANSQVGGQVTVVTGASGSAVVTSAVDTTAAQDLVITGQLANSGETITLESYLVEVVI